MMFVKITFLVKWEGTTEMLLCSVPQLFFAGAFVLPRSCEEFPVSVHACFRHFWQILQTLYLQPMCVRLEFNPGRSSSPPPVCPILNRSHEM